MLSELILGRFLPKQSGTFGVRGTGTASAAIAQVEPPNLEMTRAGRRFYLGQSAAVTGIAPVQAIPTTAAQWVIWNADTVRTYWFEELGEYLTSGTPGLGGSLWFTIFSTPAQTGAIATGLAVQNASQGGLTSKAIVKSAVTIATPTAPPWFRLYENTSTVTAAAFSAGYSNGFVRYDLGGAIALQPGQGLGLAVLAPTGTTPLYAPVARWVELESDME